MTFDQRNCKDFLNANSRKFGIADTNLRSEYLDICAQHVRCIASRRIDEKIVLPSMSNFINSCTGLVDSAGGIDTQFASLRVTHATEELVDCDTNCPGVKVIIKGQIIVRTKNCNPCCAPSYMAIPVELCSETIRDFYSTATGERVAQLKNELPNIDGSCMVINLNCRVCREICGGCSRYVAHIRGTVVDKLWKTENIWVEGIRPYPAPSITVLDKFSKDICTCCDDGDYISVNTVCDDDTCCETECAGCADGCGCYTNCGCGAYGGYTSGCGYNGGCGYDDGCGCTTGYGCNDGCVYNDGCGCNDTCDNGCNTARTNGCECEC